MTDRRPYWRMLFASVLTGLSLTLVGCGDDGGSVEGGSEVRKATLVLDFLPGPVHAGIYRALERGYYEERGIDLEVVEPSATADTLRLVTAGRADFGIAEGIDIATQIDAGREIKGILALTQRPLGGLITLRSSGIASPAGLEGRTVGVTGVPSDDAVVQTIVEGAGANPERVETVTIGFGGVQALAAGRVDAFTGFIPTDAVLVELNGKPTRSFAVDRFGGPSYPGLIVFSTTEQIDAEPELMSSFAAATTRGYEEVLTDLGAGVDALLGENPEIPRNFARLSLRQHVPLFTGGAGRFGIFRASRLRELSRFLLDAGLIGGEISPRDYATNRFVPRG